jgi:hypothetical protein
MPDLKSELSKVITSWNTDMPTTDATPTIINGRAVTTNATRATFNYVRDNPGVTSTQATNALHSTGVPKGSSTSLLSVMVSRGNIRKDADGKLFAVQQEYKSIKAAKPKAPKPAVVVVEPPKPVEPVETAPQINSEWDVDVMLNNLSIKQARALYDELRKIFGG